MLNNELSTEWTIVPGELSQVFNKRFIHFRLSDPFWKKRFQISSSRDFSKIRKKSSKTGHYQKIGTFVFSPISLHIRVPILGNPV